jgi:hypothetical protein
MDELRDRYHVGHHPPGHLADDEPACFDEWWLAANYLLVLMQEYADADDEAAYVVIGNSPAPRELLLDNGYPRMRAHVDAVLQDDPPREGVDYSAAVEDNDGRVIAFWLMRVLCFREDDYT